MRKRIIPVLIVLLLAVAGALVLHERWNREEPSKAVLGGERVYLPLPRLDVGGLSVEEAIAFRRSIREYESTPLTLTQISQLLWAAQGITDVAHEFRAAPSAGATYPLIVYLVVGEGGVVGLEAGVYRYDPYTHSLTLVVKGDVRQKLYEAALEQPWVRDAPASIVITAVYKRTTDRYGERGVRYVHMEAGHASQNIYLEATSLGLGTVSVGAFHGDLVKSLLGASADETPLYIMPVGVPKQKYRVTEEELHSYILEKRREAEKETQ